MDAATILESLPESDIYERDEALLKLARAGCLVVDYARVRVNDRLEVEVTRDFASWGDETDAVRLGLTAYSQQRLTDEQGGIMLTPKLCDAVAAAAREQGGLVGLAVQPINSLTSGYVLHSDEIDQALPLGHEALVDGPKHWTISADVWTKRGFVTNYGGTYSLGDQTPAPTIPSVSDPSLVVIQGPYEAHDTGTDLDGDGYADGGHGDYSQLVRWARRAWLDDVEISLPDAYRGRLGPEVAEMVSHEGALPDYRLPGVPLPDGKTHLAGPPRITRPGERGDDVRAWQLYMLGELYSLPIYGADGHHGEETELATLRWFELRGLEPLDRPAVTTSEKPQPTGIVEEEPASGTPEAPLVTTCTSGIELPEIDFRQARYYRKGRALGDPNLICIHVGQIAELEVTAERLQAYAATMADGRTASWGFAVDCDSITQSVRVGDTSFAARPGNELGIHIELAGYVGQGVEGWADSYSLRTLELAARLTGWLSVLEDIPLLRRDAFQVLELEPGVCGHSDISAASVMARRRGKRVAPWWDAVGGKWRMTNHTDPGPTFPWRSFMARARAVAAEVAAAGPSRARPWA